MRKWLLAVLLCLLPVLAWAAPETPYAVQTAPCYGLLTANQQVLLDVVYTAAAAGESRVDLPEDTLYDDAAAALTLLVTDFPELAGLQNEYALGYYQHRPEVATYAELRYIVTGEALHSMRRALLSAADALVYGVTGGDFARELALHDALCARVSYDLSGPNAHNAYGALAEGRAACEGYAQAMTLLCRLAGIPCTTVTGMAWDGTYMQPHAWNMVQIGGLWGHVDATFNDQQEMLHWYFNLSDQQLSADHQAEQLPNLPEGTGEAEYHALLGLKAATVAEAEAVLARELPTGRVSIRFTDKGAYEAFLADLPGVMARAAFYGSYRVLKSDQQLCIMLMAP